MTDPIKSVDHGTEEKFCPECYDYRPGDVTEAQGPGGGTLAVGWSCLKCDYTDDIGNVPHDADHLEELREAQEREDVRREQRRGPFK